MLLPLSRLKLTITLDFAEGATMADFSGLTGDLATLRSTLADALADVAAILAGDSVDQQAVDMARAEIQSITEQLRAGIPDVAPAPEPPPEGEPA